MLLNNVPFARHAFHFFDALDFGKFVERIAQFLLIQRFEAYGLAHLIGVG